MRDFDSHIIMLTLQFHLWIVQLILNRATTDAYLCCRQRQVLHEYWGHDWLQTCLFHQVVLDDPDSWDLRCESDWTNQIHISCHKTSDDSWAASVLQMTNNMNDIYGSNAVLRVLQGIFLFFLIKYKPLKYNNVYTYPDWGYGIGWFMAMSSMVCIPLGIIWMIWKTPGTFSEVKPRAANSWL